MRIYRETFDDGPGGWYGFISNSEGVKSLPVRDGYACSQSPWWIDYNHAPPGAGYMNLLYMLNTRGIPGEHHREVAGRNRFIASGVGSNFTNAVVSVRLRGELLARGAQMVLLVQGYQGPHCCGWLLTGQPIQVTPDWSQQTITCTTNEADWTSLGSRHDRTDFYGQAPLADILRDVNMNILFVLFPLDIEPMGQLTGDMHIKRPERDYPVWRSRLPEGYVHLDEVRIEFPC